MASDWSDEKARELLVGYADDFLPTQETDALANSIAQALREARDSALEEASQECTRYGFLYVQNIAYVLSRRIRALKKDQPLFSLQTK